MQVEKVARLAAVMAGLIVGGAGLGALFGRILLDSLGFFMHPLHDVSQSWQSQILAITVGTIVGGALGPLIVWNRKRARTDAPQLPPVQ